MSTQPPPESGTKMWALKPNTTEGTQIIEVTTLEKSTNEGKIWVQPVEQAPAFKAPFDNLFPTRETAVTQWIARLKQTAQSIAEELSKWAPESVACNEMWKPGPIPANNNVPCLVLWDNGNESVLWNGETDNQTFVVAYCPVPPKPELGYEPKAYRDDRQNWVGKYFWKEQG